MSNTLLELGCLRRAQGDLGGATKAFAESVRLRREMDDNSGLVTGLVALAEAYLDAHQSEPARLACAEALMLARRHALEQVDRITELLDRC